MRRRTLLRQLGVLSTLSGLSGEVLVQLTGIRTPLPLAVKHANADPATAIAVASALISAVEAFSEKPDPASAMLGANTRLLSVVLAQLDAINRAMATLLTSFAQLRIDLPELLDAANVRDDVRHLYGSATVALEIQREKLTQTRRPAPYFRRQYQQVLATFDNYRGAVSQNFGSDAVVAAPVILGMNAWLPTVLGLSKSAIRERLLTLEHWLESSLKDGTPGSLSWQLVDAREKYDKTVEECASSPLYGPALIRDGLPLAGPRLVACSGYISYPYTKKEFRKHFSFDEEGRHTDVVEEDVTDDGRPFYSRLDMSDSLTAPTVDIGAIAWSLSAQQPAVFTHGAPNISGCGPDDNSRYTDPAKIQEQLSKVSNTLQYAQYRPQFEIRLAARNAAAYAVAYLYRLETVVRRTIAQSRSTRALLAGPA